MTALPLPCAFLLPATGLFLGWREAARLGPAALDAKVLIRRAPYLLILLPLAIAAFAFRAIDEPNFIWHQSDLLLVWTPPSVRGLPSSLSACWPGWRPACLATALWWPPAASSRWRPHPWAAVVDGGPGEAFLGRAGD